MAGHENGQSQSKRASALEIIDLKKVKIKDSPCKDDSQVTGTDHSVMEPPPLSN